MSNIKKSNEPIAHAAIFQEKTIRRAWHNEEWWFAVVDVVAVLTDSTDVKQYIKIFQMSVIFLISNAMDNINIPTITVQLFWQIY